MSKMHMRRFGAAAGAVLVLIAAASCGSNSSGSGSSASGKGDVVVYGWSGDWDLWFKDWATKFKDETGYTIKYVSGPGATMRQRITAERAAKSDVFVSTPSDAYLLQQKGLLADIPWDQVPTAKYIDARFKKPQVAVWGYDMQLPAYNTKFVKPDQAPKSWKDLADPKWKGKLGLYAPTDEGSTRHVMVMINKYGEPAALDLVKKQYENAKLTFNTPGVAESSLANGDTWVNTISMGSAMVVLKEAGASIKTIDPAEGVFLMLNSLTMMKKAPNKEGAEAFVKFFLSDSMQSEIMNNLGISVAVDSNVKLTNKSLAQGLGGKTVEQVLSTAYTPDWADWIKTEGNGQTKLSDLVSEITKRAQK